MYIPTHPVETGDFNFSFCLSAVLGLPCFAASWRAYFSFARFCFGVWACCLSLWFSMSINQRGTFDKYYKDWMMFTIVYVRMNVCLV